MPAEDTKPYSHIKKVYEDADYKHVRRVVVYGKAATEEGQPDLLYADPEFTKILYPEEVLEAYLNGTLLVYESADGTESSDIAWARPYFMFTRNGETAYKAGSDLNFVVAKS